MTYSWNRAFESYPSGSMRALTMGEGLRRLKRAFDERLSVQHDVVDTGIPTNGLVAYWPFDEGSGDIARDAAGYNHGTLEGDPDWVAGPAGGALRFLGPHLTGEEFVDISDAPVYEWSTDSWTMTCLVRFPDLDQVPDNNRTGIFHFGEYQGSYGIGILYGNTLQVQLRGGATGGGIREVDLHAAIQGEWVFAVMVSTPGALKGYYNGEFIGQDTAALTGDYSDGYSPAIGHVGGSRILGGNDPNKDMLVEVAEPRIYDRALTEAEIQTLYNEVVPFRVRHRPGEASVVKLLGENDVSMSDFVEGAFKFKPPSLDRDSGMMMQAVVFGHHGDYSGLNMDDHPQYLRVNGDRDLTGNVHMKDVVNLSTTGSDYDPLWSSNNRVMSRSGHLSLVSGRARHADGVVTSSVISNYPEGFQWNSGKFSRVQESQLIDQNIEIEDDTGWSSMVSGLSISGLSGDGYLAIRAADKDTSDPPSLPYHFEVGQNGTLELTIHWMRED